MSNPDTVQGCPICGKIQLVDASSPLCPCCFRCGHSLKSPWWHNRSLAAALAVSALILYVPAILMPMMELETLGHRTRASILEGVQALLATRHYVVGILILVFSLVLPPLKLVALLLLACGLVRGTGQARLHHLVEVIGRWGMLDVLVVAVLIAFIKVGDTFRITPGPGLVFFLACVLVSLLSSVCLHLPSLWEE